MCQDRRSVRRCVTNFTGEWTDEWGGISAAAVFSSIRRLARSDIRSGRRRVDLWRGGKAECCM